MQFRCGRCGNLQQVGDNRPLREQVLYLLKELGFDCTILQGSGNADVPLDDTTVVLAFKRQLAKSVDTVDNKGE
jgi:hypothetical protein